MAIVFILHPVAIQGVRVLADGGRNSSRCVRIGSHPHLGRSCDGSRIVFSSPLALIQGRGRRISKELLRRESCILGNRDEEVILYSTRISDCMTRSCSGRGSVAGCNLSGRRGVDHAVSSLVLQPGAIFWANRAITRQAQMRVALSERLGLLKNFENFLGSSIAVLWEGVLLISRDAC